MIITDERPKLHQTIDFDIKTSTYQIPVSFATYMDTETIGEKDWDELQKNLEATIPVYDKINRFATLGQVSKWRKKHRI